MILAQQKVAMSGQRKAPPVTLKKPRISPGVPRISRVPHASRVPRGVRIYAIGDIHGRLDLLEIIHHAILKDAKSASGMKKILIHLGDYIDRGPDSFGVVERLIHTTLDGFEIINLMGNHEDFLLNFLKEKKGQPSLLDSWQANGCMETFLSYDFDINKLENHPPDVKTEVVRQQFATRMPNAHLKFLKKLKLRHTIGDYLFVHAGINPDIALHRQKHDDLLWIRDRFIEHPGPFGKVIVHGHTIFEKPEVLDHRIGIDTGAYYSGHLTCLVLEGTDQHFLET